MMIKIIFLTGAMVIKNEKALAYYLASIKMVGYQKTKKRRQKNCGDKQDLLHLVTGYKKFFDTKRI